MTFKKHRPEYKRGDIVIYTTVIFDAYGNVDWESEFAMILEVRNLVKTVTIFTQKTNRRVTSVTFAEIHKPK